MKSIYFRRVISVIFALLISAMCFIPVSAVSSGDCGAGVDWSFDETAGVLTISGSGAMADYNDADDTPWVTFKDKIKKITVSDGVTTIGKYAFNSCYNVTEVSLPEGITSIGFGSFDSCTSLKSITIPSTVNKLYDSPFFNCSSLEKITVSDANKSFCSDNDGVVYSKDKTELIQYPCGRQSANFSLPYTVTAINKAAFAGAEKLVNVVIPESTKTIDAMSFYGCTSLKIITVPKSIELIGEKAFSRCDNLSEVYYSGTQEDWNSITLRNNNESLTSATFSYEAKGPDSVPENTPVTTVPSTSAVQPTAVSPLTPEKVAEKREIIPIIIIAIAVVVLALLAVLIKVIVTKKPDTKKE